MTTRTQFSLILNWVLVVKSGLWTYMQAMAANKMNRHMAKWDEEMVHQSYICRTSSSGVGGWKFYHAADFMLR